jgi:hypothetical protein
MAHFDCVGEACSSLFLQRLPSSSKHGMFPCCKHAFECLCFSGIRSSALAAWPISSVADYWVCASCLVMFTAKGRSCRVDKKCFWRWEQSLSRSCADGDVPNRYMCCQGQVCGEVFNKITQPCPRFCLVVEVMMCFWCALGANRSLIQQAYRLQNTWYGPVRTALSIITVGSRLRL